jgi:hypothetical protein
MTTTSKNGSRWKPATEGLARKRHDARERIFSLIADNRQRLLAFDPAASCDQKLLELGAWVGSLAPMVLGKLSYQSWLVAIAAHCVGWVESNPGPVKDVFAAIHAERERQAELLRKGQIGFDVAHPLPDARRKFRVLLEEVGEVAKECDQLEQTPKSRTVWPFLREELIQVAAVCVAWLESLEVQS